MYKIYLKNSKGQAFCKYIDSLYIKNQFIKKVKYSTEIEYLGCVKI